MTQQTLEQLKQKLSLFNEVISDPIFMKWNKKYDMMIKGGKVYMMVFHTQKERILFVEVEIEENKFKFLKENIILPESLNMADAGRDFGNKLLKV